MKPKNNTLQHLGLITLAFAGLSPFGTQSAQAATITWDNTATDFNTNTSWTGGVLPGSGDNATFSSAVTNQPNLSANFGPIQGLTFSTATGGWDLTKTGTAALTLSNVGTGASSAINATNSSGTNTVAANLVLGGAAATTATFTQAGGGTLALSGDISSTNVITGLTFASSAGTATYTLSGNNTYSGTTNISTTVGTSVVRATTSGALSSGPVFIGGGSNAANRLELVGNITLANAITQAGRNSTVGSAASILNVSGNNTLSGTVTVVTGGANSTIQSDSGLLTLSNATAITIGAPATGARGILLTGAGDIAVTGAMTNGTGTLQLDKRGTGTVTLSGANTYTGKTTVSAGTLQFTKQTSLYNNNTASWTAANINVASGATLALNVGGSGEFTSSDLNTLLTNISVAGSATVGLQNGANIALDSTNAGGSFTQGNVIANSTGTGGGAIGLTKLGTGTLVLDKTNTYTGATNVNAGKLVVGVGGAGSITSNVNVASAAILGGSGTISGSVTLAAESGVGLKNGGTLAAGNSPGTFTVTGSTTFNTGSIFEWDIDSSLGQADTDAGIGFDSVKTASLSGPDASVFKVVLASGDTFASDFWNSAHDWTNIFSTDGTTATALNIASIFSSFSGTGVASDGTVSGQGLFTFTGGGSTLTWSAVPEPTTALSGLLVTAGLLRRRRKN